MQDLEFMLKEHLCWFRRSTIAEGQGAYNWWSIGSRNKHGSIDVSTSSKRVLGFINQKKEGANSNLVETFQLDLSSMFHGSTMFADVNNDMTTVVKRSLDRSLLLFCLIWGRSHRNGKWHNLWSLCISLDEQRQSSPQHGESNWVRNGLCQLLRCWRYDLWVWWIQALWQYQRFVLSQCLDTHKANRFGITSGKYLGVNHSYEVNGPVAADFK